MTSEETLAANIDVSNRAYALHAEAMQLAADRKFEDAAAKWDECVTLSPEEPIYLREYAECLANLKRWDDDLHYALMAAALEPSNAQAWGLAGAACMLLGRYDEAKLYLDRSDTYGPNCFSTLTNRSMLDLQHGRYESGWRDYEWRFSGQAMRTIKPRWDGGPIPGQNLLVWCEQGYGDIIQMVRFLDLVKERSGAHVALEIPQEMLTLLHGNTAADELVLRHPGYSVPFRDYVHVPMMSLPYVLGLNDESAFWTKTYLSLAGAPSPEPLRPNNGGPEQLLQVGIVWHGSAMHANDDKRSMTLEQIAPLIDVEGAQFHSIQWGDSTGHAGVHEFGLTRPSMLQTAQRIAALDVLITVDTLVAHLAGAMGVPVWLLLPHVPEWRWGKDRDTTPWYPKTTLIRQTAPQDWGGVIDTARTALQCVVEQKSRKTNDDIFSKSDH